MVDPIKRRIFQRWWVSTREREGFRGSILGWWFRRILRFFGRMRFLVVVVWMPADRVVVVVVAVFVLDVGFSLARKI